MLSEWSVECGHDDPVLVVPWSDPDNPSRHFIDLRENPYDLDWLEEAAQHPHLLHALRALNAPRSPVYTAKCDVWKLTADDLAAVRLELDLIPEDSPAGIASYIDLLWRDRSTFVSFHQHEQLLHRMTRLTAPLHHPYAIMECTLRPALIEIARDVDALLLAGDLTKAGLEEEAEVLAHELEGAGVPVIAVLGNQLVLDRCQRRLEPPPAPPLPHDRRIVAGRSRGEPEVEVEAHDRPIAHLLGGDVPVERRQHLQGASTSVGGRDRGTDEDLDVVDVEVDGHLEQERLLRREVPGARRTGRSHPSPTRPSSNRSSTHWPTRRDPTHEWRRGR